MKKRKEKLKWDQVEGWHLPLEAEGVGVDDPDVGVVEELPEEPVG